VRRIYKYTVGTVGEDRMTNTMVPTGAVVRKVAMQGACPCIWMEVQTDAPVVERRFRIFGTGHDIPDGFGYVGTAFDEPWVWHVFEWQPQKTPEGTK
jgi:hypothetical protein